jgi:hypothetical protein
MRPFGGEASRRAERTQYEPGQGFQRMTTVHTILRDALTLSKRTYVRQHLADIPIAALKCPRLE